MNGLTIYIELEALFDFRYGFLLDKYKDLDTEMILKFLDYKNRDTDMMERIFPEVKVNALDELVINERIKLKSPLTDLSILLNKILRAIVSRPEHRESTTTILLNFKDYPYTKSEMLRIRNVFKLLIPKQFKCKIKTLQVPEEKLTPKYFSTNCNIAFIYDFSGFINKHKPKDRTMFAGVCFYTPIRLLTRKELWLKSFTDLSMDDMEPAAALTEHISILVECYFTSLDYFSAKELFIPKWS